MKLWEICWDEISYIGGRCCHSYVTRQVRAKTYEDAYAKFERKYGTIVGDHRMLMGHFTIKEIH